MEIEKIFCELDGKPSFGRIWGSVILMIYFLFAGFIVYTKADLPDIPPILAGIVVGLYGLNKIATAIIERGKKEGEKNVESPVEIS